MNGFLQNVYQLVSVLLYLLLSAIMIHRRLFRRWLSTSAGFFAAYFVGAYVFFGRVQLPVSDETMTELPLVLLSFGCVACIGYALMRQLTPAQTLGLIVCFVTVVLTGSYLAGSISTESVKAWIALGSLMALGLGLFGVLGYGMTRVDWDSGQRAGAVVVFLAVTAAVLVIVELTLGYESIQVFTAEPPAWLPTLWR